MKKRHSDWHYLLVLWAAGLILIPLWRHAPWIVATLTIFGVGAGIAAMWKQHRRRVQGFWIEYVSPNVLRAGEHDFAIVYHEGKESLFFYGDERPRPERDLLSIPNTAARDAAVPSWARGRRELITQRLLADRIAQQCDIVEYGR